MKSVPAVSLMLIAAGVSAFSQTPEAVQPPEDKGLAIVTAADAADSGWGDSVADLVMVLRNRHGDASERHFAISTLEQQNDGDKSLAVFDRPPDINGTALLTFSHKTGDDDQWLYLPALKRVKRISSSNQSGPFMGSEFAYEDLASREVEKYTYKYLREETVDGQPCDVIERVPVHPKSGYTRQELWLGKDMGQPLKIVYYDRKNDLLKTYTARDFQRHLNKYWRPGAMHMENHQTGKSTELRWENYRFQTGLTERDFDQSSLARSR